jgi:DDE superfamily endonuclease
MWHGVGEPRRVPTPGTNITRALFGALHMRTGRWVFLVRERLRKEDVIAFLEPLLVAYPQGPIVLIVDHFSSHTAHAVTAWLCRHPRIQLCYLPKYCSHVNPVERMRLLASGQSPYCTGQGGSIEPRDTDNLNELPQPSCLPAKNVDGGCSS